MNELSLFSGYGGFSMGLRLAGIPIRTVGYIEIDEYCQQIIQARIKDGFLDDAPIFPDISAFDGEQCRGLVDIITGGFPCQDLSVAGNQRGLNAGRSGLWWEMLRLIREVGPRYVLIENVPGILIRGQAGTVVGELSALGYDCVWHCVPAASVGAPHLRWRWWCLAYSNSARQWNQFPSTNTAINGQVGDVADATQLVGRRESERLSGSALSASLGPGSPDVADATGGRKGGLHLRQRGPHEAPADSDGNSQDVADTHKLDGNDGGLGATAVCRRQPSTARIPGSVSWAGWWTVEPHFC